MTKIGPCDWIVEWANQDRAILPSWDYPHPCQMNKILSGNKVIYPLLTKLVWSKRLDIGQVLFLHVNGWVYWKFSSNFIIGTCWQWKSTVSQEAIN